MDKGVFSQRFLEQQTLHMHRCILVLLVGLWVNNGKKVNFCLMGYSADFRWGLTGEQKFMAPVTEQSQLQSPENLCVWPALCSNEEYKDNAFIRQIRRSN